MKKTISMIGILIISQSTIAAPAIIEYGCSIRDQISGQMVVGSSTSVEVDMSEEKAYIYTKPVVPNAVKNLTTTLLLEPQTLGPETRYVYSGENSLGIMESISFSIVKDTAILTRSYKRMDNKTSTTVVNICVRDGSENEMDMTDITIMNDIIAAIERTKEAKTFSKNAQFDKVTAAFSADKRDSIISAEGLLIRGGDIACGTLKLTIKRSRTMKGFFSVTNYEATLDTSALMKMSLCKVSD